ncbi:MAG: phosphonate ABC transporter ATP-binding protein [Sneathiella sp.]|mgnify:FL=1|uniref:phosphonate ABC transporter ATP-binding protein n=1 Tax=Sneathiella sp. TaxID=1964365 RepID=UPI000C44EA4B|nr:phosphonate ABC transporter ATP-binding protein [Sneathiella sp.]MAZ02207.1 phosphonate ABC transporter ATP-binding protein [Sneathiella sp.]
MVAISVRNLDKTFGRNKALKNVSVELDEKEMVALIGASGSGKSTLIRHIAGLVVSDKGRGEINVFGTAIQKDGTLAKGVRKHRREIGVVFQQFNLVGRLTVLTNVLMGVLGVAPSWRTLLGIFTNEEKQKAMNALGRVGIASHAAQRSSNLSGGQQQRAAIARTIVQGAKLILADEPIASLDPASSRKVMDNLAHVNREDGVTVLVSLHQVDYAIKYCPRTIAMREGEVVFDGPSHRLTPEFLQEIYGADSIELLSPEEQRRKAESKRADQPAQPAADGDLVLAYAAR